MIVVSTISYKFNIGGEYTRIMKAKMGLRQEDPISPFIFVVVMEYLHRSLHKLSKITDFNFYAKCEKLQIINVSLADDLLLFARGDTKSIDLLMKKTFEFSKAASLHVNLAKCKALYGGVDSPVKIEILGVTSFVERDLSFRYLGIPLTSKKLSIHHCIGPIDRIVSCIKHWSTKLLSYAGRVQLINNITIYISSCWM